MRYLFILWLLCIAGCGVSNPSGYHKTISGEPIMATPILVSSFFDATTHFTGTLDIQNTLYLEPFPILNGYFLPDFQGFSYILFDHASQLAYRAQVAKYMGTSWWKHDPTILSTLSGEVIGMKPKGNCMVFTSEITTQNVLLDLPHGGIMGISPYKKYIIDYPIVSEWYWSLRSLTGGSIPSRSSDIPQFDQENYKNVLLNTVQQEIDWSLSFLYTESVMPSMIQSGVVYTGSLRHRECETPNFSSIVVTIFPPKGLTEPSQYSIGNFSLQLHGPKIATPRFYLRKNWTRLMNQGSPDIGDEGKSVTWHDLTQDQIDDVEVIFDNWLWNSIASN